MKIAYYSDLHLEFLDWTPPLLSDDVDLIILDGDIHSRDKGVRWAKLHFKQPVLYIAGNHEYYSQQNINMDQINEEMQKAAKGSNVHVLNNDAVVIGGVNFVCSTLWTDFNLYNNQEVSMLLAKRMMNDFRLIKIKSDSRQNCTLSPRHTIDFHKDSLEFIVSVLDSNRKNVIITHHGVHEKCSHPQFHGSDLTSAFNTDLTNFITKHKLKINAWIYGHTHHNLDFEISGVPILTNQRGYASHELVPGFLTDKILYI